MRGVAATLFLVLLSVLAAYGLMHIILPCSVRAQGPCGNSCISSSDCMTGCVCMQEDPPNLGICVSFN